MEGKYDMDRNDSKSHLTIRREVERADAGIYHCTCVVESPLATKGQL